MFADDFPKDPYGWLTNQTGHIVVGLAGTGLAGELLSRWWIAEPIAAFVVVPLIYYILFELWGGGARLLWDSLVDTFFVMLGGVAVMSLAGDVVPFWSVVLVAAATLRAGYWRRL